MALTIILSVWDFNIFIRFLYLTDPVFNVSLEKLGIRAGLPLE
jgi:hypothetical protein